MGFWTGVLTGCAVTGAGLWLAWPKTFKATLLGHRYFPVAEASELVSVEPTGKVLMRPKAADAFTAMRLAAAQTGVQLVPLSGFRDLEHQDRLFFDEAAVHNQTLRQRAWTCAPPGFSEHHTGYSLDIGDAATQQDNLEGSFSKSQGFQWLKAHAAAFHFELSFPAGNPQGVRYEPWHWRYVGDAPSFWTFYLGRIKGL